MSDPFLKLLGNIKKTRYARKNKAIRLTKDDLINQFNEQNGECYWFGTTLIPHQIFDTDNPNTMSVDRIDNNKGYTKQNIIITTRAANYGRNSTGYDEWKEFIKTIKVK